MATKQTTAAPEVPKTAGYRIVKQQQSRYFAVRDPAGELVCITVYRKGAAEVVRRLAA